MRKSCCIKTCKNNNLKTTNQPNSRNVKFYYFPSNNPHMPWLQQKRILWINAVKKYAKHPDDWKPGKYALICSTHFVGNEKSEDPSHPSYLPKIFGINTNPQYSMQKLERWKRKQRRAARLEEKKSKNTCKMMAPVEVDDTKDVNKVTRSITCQTDECLIKSCDVTYLMCNIHDKNSAEIQVNIVNKRTADKFCEANYPVLKKIMKDFACDPIDQSSQSLYCSGFHGINSLRTESNFSSITGVSKSVFELLLNLLPAVQTSTINKQTKLLITLMKLKTGLCYSALSVLFQLHTTTIRRIFLIMIFHLIILLNKFITWPSKATVLSNMPEAFKRHYPNTRVIIDCTEVHTEQPSDVRRKVFLYSAYKHGYTVKFLVGCTPCGLISYVSNCYGGRTSDAFITNDCGILNLLEPGDVILADKGFPTIRTSVESKNAIIVLPPFLHDLQFTPEEVEQTYNIASVRIHIERINQRIKNFHILDKLPNHLIHMIDKIVYVICALVNVENPIIKH